MQENSIKGLLTEIQCEKDFISRGFLVSKPVTQDSKYDFIVDIKNNLYKIQCKSASLLEDGSAIHISTKTTNIRTMKNSYYTDKDIDYFYTTYNNIGYLIPVTKAAKGETTLRFSSKNGSNPNIKWAKEYEIDVIIKKIQEEVNN